MRRRIRLHGLAAALILATAVAASSAPMVAGDVKADAAAVASVNSDLQIAGEYMVFGQTGDAVGAYRRVLTRDPGNLQALLGVAVCHDRQGSRKLAVAELRAALLQHRESALAAILYMDVARRDGRIEEAVAVVKQLLRPRKSEAADSYWRIAVWMVQRDHWHAQYFSKLAHALNPLAYPEKIEAPPVRLKTEWGSGYIVYPGDSLAAPSSLPEPSHDEPAVEEAETSSAGDLSE